MLLYVQLSFTFDLVTLEVSTELLIFDSSESHTVQRKRGEADVKANNVVLNIKQTRLYVHIHIFYIFDRRNTAFSFNHGLI